jgi:hypothetical protein
MVFGYLALFILTKKFRGLILVACVIHGIDTVIMFIYVLYYGVVAYAGYNLLYGLIVFGFPIMCLVFLIRGAMAQRHICDTDDISGYRGYSGYGGSGFGGYRGRGFHGRGGYGGFGG